MQTKAWKEFRLSHMMLGTVQFGLPYGVANRTGQPEYRDVLAMVAAAVEGGVNCFDTAAAYGSSEEVLGRALRELGLTDQVVIVTKVQQLTPIEQADATLAQRTIEKSIDESRRRLQLDCLPVVLFHRQSDAAHFDVLEKLKAKHCLKYAGVSCDHHPGAASAFIARHEVSAVQLPANILDWRHPRSGVLHAAAQQGVAVFIRSVFLQGLLLMPEESIPEYLRAVVPVRRRLDALAASAGMTLKELAVCTMLGQEGVTCLLVGVETVQQVRENIALFDRGPLSADLLAAVAAAATELPETVVTPALWHAQRAASRQEVNLSSRP